MFGCGTALFGGQQFFIQFFAGPQPRKLDLDVFMGNQAGQFNQVASQIDNFDGFTHVENKHLAAVRHRAGLQHQLRSLRDRHEITAHIGMSNGNRFPFGDLLPEQLNDTAPTAQHITKTNCGKLCSAFVVQRADDHLGNPFGYPHDAGRINCLVRGNHNETFGFGGNCRPSHHHGAENIILNSLHRLAFHQRNMFVGCGMEDDFRPPFGKNTANSLFIADIRNDWLHIQVGI